MKSLQHPSEHLLFHVPQGSSGQWHEGNTPKSDFRAKIPLPNVPGAVPALLGSAQSLVVTTSAQGCQQDATTLSTWWEMWI